MDIAIVGGGIAGLAAARALVHRHRVTLYEAAAAPGGHVHTVATPDGPVDMGFIVMNRERYPLMCRMLGELGIATRPTTMAFSVAAGGVEWGSASLSAMFADRRRLVDPRHWRFLVRVLAFARRAARDVDTAALARESLDEYLARTDTPAEVRDGFVVPLAAALWSLAPERCGAFPAATFVRFLEHHGMLDPVRPLTWHTITGGSRRYVDALVAELAASGRFTLRAATKVARIERDDRGVSVDGSDHERVVLATHADTALALLAAPTDHERRVLGAFRYSANHTVLHTDRTFLPRHADAHAAWNYVADPDTARVAVTYSMTRLQGLPDAPYLVTLNPRRRPHNVLAELTFHHPQLDAAALAAQAALPRLSGVRHTYYAGAHFGFGFHEDGMRAGLAAAARLEADA